MPAIFLGIEMEGQTWSNEGRGKYLQFTYLLDCPKWYLHAHGSGYGIWVLTKCNEWGKEFGWKDLHDLLEKEAQSKIHSRLSAAEIEMTMEP